MVENMLYTARMTRTIIFDIKADSMKEAKEWCNTHDFDDVEETSVYWDVERSSHVGELEDDGYVAIDISSNNK